MSARNNGGPAFPIENTNDIPDDWKGMTLRDWFAGQALAGISQDIEGYRSLNDVAIDAYNQADAMLAERDQNNSE